MRLLCGRLLPVTLTMFGFMRASDGVAELEKVCVGDAFTGTAPVGETAGALRLVKSACAVWGWAGTSEARSVRESSPLDSPRSRSERPGPCPCCIGTEPCRLGRAKFDLPSPP